MDARLVRLALQIDLLLLSLSDNDHDPTAPLPPCSSHPLHQPDGTLVSIKADNEVNLSDVQSFLSDTCSYQGVVTSLTKVAHHLKVRERATSTVMCCTCILDCSAGPQD